MAQQPQGGAFDQTIQFGQHGILRGGGDFAVQLFDALPHAAQGKGIAHDDISAGDLRGMSAGAIHDLGNEARPHAVDHRIGHMGGDDLAAQTVSIDLRQETLLQQAWEIMMQIFDQGRFFRQIGGQDLVLHPNLGISKQNRQFRPRQTLTRGCALAQTRIVGQEFHSAIQPRCFF